MILTDIWLYNRFLFNVYNVDIDKKQRSIRDNRTAYLCEIRMFVRNTYVFISYEIYARIYYQTGFVENTLKYSWLLSRCNIISYHL